MQDSTEDRIKKIYLARYQISQSAHLDFSTPSKDLDQENSNACGNDSEGLEGDAKFGEHSASMGSYCFKRGSMCGNVEELVALGFAELLKGLVIDILAFHGQPVKTPRIP